MRLCRWKSALLPLILLSCWILSCEEIKEEYGRDEIMAKIARLEDRRQLDTAAVQGWSLSPDSLVRQRLAYLTGISYDTLYRPVLTRLLQDSIYAVRHEAIFAAGQTRDSSFAPLLNRLTTSSDSTTTSRALQALSKVGSDLAGRKLSALMRDSLQPGWVRAEAAQASFRLKDDATLAALIELGRIEDNQIREKIYYSLLRRAEPEMQRLFKIGMRDTLPQVQVYSVIGTGRIGDTTSVGRVAALLRKPDWRRKYHALEAVGRLKLKTLVKAVSNLLAEDENVYVRRAAIRTLGELGSTVMSKRLTRFLEDANANLAGEALVALAKLRGEKLLPKAMEFSQSANPALRQAAALALGEIGGKQAVDALAEMFGDSVAAVRGEALDRIFALGDDSLSRVFCERGLTDADVIPVVLCCNQIAEQHYEYLLGDLCRQFYRDEGADLQDIRASIFETLLEFGDSLEADQVITEVVAAGLKDKRYAIRKRAAQVAEQLGLPSDYRWAFYESEISVSNYSDIFRRFPQNPRALLKTSRGDILIELYYDKAPRTVTNFVTLAESGFYDQRVWHRVVPDFVIQDGSRGDGWGGPGYEIRCEYNDLSYRKGSVGMATSGKDTGGSQYFICQSDQPHLDGRYTLFGNVLDGIRAVTLTEVGDSIFSIKILTD